MSAEQRQAVIRSAYFMRSTNIEAWDAFVEAVAALSTAMCEEACKASVDSAIVSHGRAQSYLAIRDLLRDIVPEYEKLRKR